MANAEAKDPRLRDHAYSSFTEKLLAQDLHPGQFVSQRELVELTGMPLGAIREMIPRLEADGLIQAVPKRGLQVLSIDLDLVRNAFQLRRIIEREAITHFCKSASEDDLDTLYREHSAVREEARAGVTPDVLGRAQRIDWGFHDLIIDRLDNQIISDIHRINAIKIRLIRNSDTRMLPDLAVFVLDEHLTIINALRERDPERANTALQNHIESARRRALGL